MTAKTMRPGEITEDQSAAIAFLSDPATHGGATPERVDTHAAMVFLAGDRAYKLKRAVWFPFLDFSTLEKRRVACKAELLLNRRTAPDLYLDCVPLTQGPRRTLALGGKGEVVEWVVVMRRFDEDSLFSHMAERGALTEAHITDLADSVASFHTEAAVRPDHGGAAAMRWVVEDNLKEISEEPGVFPPDQTSRLAELSRDALARVASNLDRRRADGFVRHCHGDLHLRNICLWRGRPTLFDCLEFDEGLACTDVLYDLAFLLMDLEHRGLRRFANLTFNRYLQRTGDLSGLAALPLFLSCRAAIRAKVDASAIPHQTDDAVRNSMRASARDYLDQAVRCLEPPPPQLLAVGGESGSGKSTVAALTAPQIGSPPGALILRSDVIRKRLFGRRMEDRLPEEAYGGDATERTYARIIEEATLALDAGMTVIADAVYARPDERDALEAAAADAGVPFAGFWLDAPLEVRMDRVGGRSADASDATVEFLRRAPSRECGAMRWTRIDASGCADGACRAILDRLVGQAGA